MTEIEHPTVAYKLRHHGPVPKRVFKADHSRYVVQALVARHQGVLLERGDHVVGVADNLFRLSDGDRVRVAESVPGLDEFGQEEQDHAVYVEPNVWVRHAVSG